MSEIKWVAWGSGLKECEHVPGMGGWFGFENPNIGAAISGHSASHRWEDYINGLKSPECANSIRDLIIERWPTGDPPGGFWHQGQESDDEETVPVAACGGTAEFSMRAWGDIVAAAISERDNKDYRYTDFAWG